MTVGHGSLVRPDVDVVRRARRSAFLLPAVVLGLGVPRMVLTGEYAGLHGDLAWTVLVTVAVLTAVVPLLAPLVPALERRAADAARVHVALHAHTDPGPWLRERADLAARRLVRLHWVGRLMPVLPIVLLVQADWDRPGATPAAVVVVAGYAALQSWHRRQTLAAARWVADPAGPWRDAPPTPWWEPWLGGRRMLALAGLYTVTVVVVVLATSG
ncbi:hypothetical protein GCM10027451_07300 [Geodermatophilus aquaeductus]|uniref:Uncharacterized protein n=1 Tax=Geodermatophilus aquaeductus TaxID=1564161 RepID=A0A521DD21_9ACTN|nr:hypothetical protein [Geodermatophilus aquaeductus]SMO69536.1 hypothetical protein SAMN06273567_10386 [Geodermatophilus aquaeductus]